MLMLAFGLGTLPNLLLMGVAAAQLNRWVRKPAVRRIAGTLVMGFGVLLLLDAWGR
jgi:sulfite exporter TauE/SafE